MTDWVPSAAGLSLCLLVLWGISVRIKDSSIIDLFWGPAFSVIFWPAAISHGLTPRAVLVGVMLSFWGLRLGLYLARRNLGHGEDKRYTAMRNRHGAAWWWRSLFIVFGLQGALAWVVSWPVRVVAGSGDVSVWNPLDALATLIVLSGIGFEAIGDWQLARFKARRALLALAPHPDPLPASQGEGILNSGLWRYTRHPNYFGNFLLWLGFGVFGVATGAWWSAIGPAVMTFLLVKVSGKELLERGMKDRPGYAEYVRSTSGFIPWPPRRS